MSKKIMLLIILLLLISIVVVICTSLNNSESNETIEQLGQIKADELQNSLINELKNTSLNVNNSSMETYFGTQNTDSMDLSLSLYYDFVMWQYKENKENNGYVFAFISSKNNNIGVMIPCFKIDSDSNGNFKNIIFPSHVGAGGNVYVPVKSIMWNTIEKVFKEKYDIDVSKYSEFGKGKCLLSGNVNIMALDSNRDYTIQVFKEISNNTNGYSWNYSKDEEVRNGNVFEDLEMNQEVFGLDTIETKDQFLNKNYIIDNSDNDTKKLDKDILFKIDNKYINKYGYITNYKDASAVEVRGITVTDSQQKLDIELFKNLSDLIITLKENELLYLVDLIDVSNESDIDIYMNSENKVIKFGDYSNTNLKCVYTKNILNLEKGNTGEICVNVELDNGEKPYFREKAN